MAIRVPVLTVTTVLSYLGACRRQTPRGGADLRVPKGVSHSDLSSVVALGVHRPDAQKTQVVLVSDVVLEILDIVGDIFNTAYLQKFREKCNSNILFTVRCVAIHTCVCVRLGMACMNVCASAHALVSGSVSVAL